MSYVIAIGIGLVCLGLVNVWVLRSPQARNLDSLDRPTPTQIADAPPPEDRGTPGQRG